MPHGGASWQGHAGSLIPGPLQGILQTVIEKGTALELVEMMCGLSGQKLT